MIKWISVQAQGVPWGRGVLQAATWNSPVHLSQRHHRPYDRGLRSAAAAAAATAMAASGRAGAGTGGAAAGTGGAVAAVPASSPGAAVFAAPAAIAVAVAAIVAFKVEGDDRMTSMRQAHMSACRAGTRSALSWSGEPDTSLRGTHPRQKSCVIKLCRR